MRKKRKKKVGGYHLPPLSRTTGGEKKSETHAPSSGKKGRSTTIFPVASPRKEKRKRGKKARLLHLVCRKRKWFTNASRRNLHLPQKPAKKKGKRKKKERAGAPISVFDA